MEDTRFNVDEEYLSENCRKIAEYLLPHKDEILRQFAEAGIHEDETAPYVYYVPTGLSFPIDEENVLSLRSLWAIVMMARASYARAYWLDCDKEGFPELPKFCGGKEGFHRVKITDPFAWHIDDAIKEYQNEMVRTGKARIVNGKFYKVA